MQQKITIKNISISPDGKTNIRAIALYSKDTDTIIAQCDYIKIEPAFKVIFFTWKKNPKRFDIPLTILIEGISFSQLPVKVSGNAQVELTLKIEPDNLQNIDYNGKIYLKKFNISEVPFLKEISDLNGTILVAKNIISSSDIEGKINESSATLKFSVDDFLNPKLKISGELPPLSFDIDCSLSDNNLNISRILANYNQIKFKLSGLINDIQKDRNAELSAELNLNLEELDQLPLNVKEFLSTLAPSGTITSSAKINGALSDISNLKGTIELNSPGISILKYSIKDIALKAELNQGLLNVEKLSASVFETLLELQAKLDIKNTSLPFEANIKTGRLSLKAVMDTLKLQPKISADILADCTIKGYAANPNNINAEVNVTLEKFSYETFSFNNPVFLSAVILIENLKDIKISSLLIKDNTVNIKTSGLVKNLYSPVLDLTADITCQLDNLKTYPIALPENFALGGIINIPLNITGPALNPAEINAGFGINAKQLTLGQFELESIDLKGSLTNLKLAIPQINVGLYQGTLNAQVNIDFAQAQPPAFDLRAYIENLNIESFAKKTNLLSPDFRGTLFSEIDLKGKGFDPKKLDANTQANIRLENANIQGFPLEKVRLDAKTSCKNETIDILELKLLYKTIEINSKATLNSFLKNPIIEAQLSTDLDLADISKLPLEIKKTIDELMLSGKVAAQVNLRGPLEDWKSLDINAQINSKRAGIKNIIFEDFNLTSRFTNKILTLNAERRRKQLKYTFRQS
ncbi:MAG: hypothetical protein HY810_05575 [Candidatus Omnitrophica bacterium]|nr:hypothetical protein [Candidatus Omnitrophota bacterium]